MKTTPAGYKIGENPAEESEAIEYNTNKKGEQFNTLTLEEKNKIITEQLTSAKLIQTWIKENQKTIKGFSCVGLKLDNYMDNVEAFHDRQPFFYDKTCMFWTWNKTESKYEK